MVSAPNGDIVGVEWDPYSGDHSTNRTPDLQRIFAVGKGDVNASSGLGASIRFDFARRRSSPGARR